MAVQKVIVVGASAGGIEASSRLMGELPRVLGAPVLLVLHVPHHATSVLPQILGRAGSLPAKHAVDGELLKPDVVYVAPPDYHLLVETGYVHLSRSPTENRHRPAVDVLFRSAAQAYGAGVVGVVLSGTRDDGSAGLGVIRERGGTTIVQDPDEAQFAGMPRNAIQREVVDHILPVAEIAAMLREWASAAVATREGLAVPEGTQRHPFEAPEHVDVASSVSEVPTRLSCPDCGGSLGEVREGSVRRFRCRVGHAYSPESMLSAQADGVEAALWRRLSRSKNEPTLRRA